MTIDSVDNKKIKNIRKLNQKKYRDETNELYDAHVQQMKQMLDGKSELKVFIL